MKKILTLILAMLYIGTSTGATFHMHYCMGKLVEVELWRGDSKKCSHCKTDLNKGCSKKCCKDEHKTVKLEKDQKVVAHALDFLQMPVADAPAYYTSLPPARVLALAEEHPVSNAPPRSSKVHPHILHCNFRI
ncbi:hypothetical protein [Chitinophaga sp. HK235]|uniref:HYC_CC_PP family protein n=1 Tax=Chitinophaga sp. HK235 TaxID=2952571 RepID=UPI001BA5DE4C|nr:hypothetical protein [Chitinophaga sp. HK235]